MVCCPLKDNGSGAGPRRSPCISRLYGTGNKRPEEFKDFEDIFMQNSLFKDYDEPLRFK